MKELLLFLAKSLVDFPNEVTVTETGNDQKLHFELNVAEKDMGRIIGKQGKNAQTIRTIMKAACAKENKKVTIDIR